MLATASIQGYFAFSLSLSKLYDLGMYFYFRKVSYSLID
jgi:hypothetical protein